MTQSKVVTYFERFCIEEEIVVVAAIRALMKFIKDDCGSVSTMTGLRLDVIKAADEIVSAKESVTSLRSGTELCVRFITYTSLDFQNFEKCRSKLIERGEVFISRLKMAKNVIAKHLHSMLSSQHIILLHGRSRVVLHALVEAVKSPSVRIRCLVTESCPDMAGKKMCEELKDAGVDCSVILDTSIGYVMQNVDLVLVGAEAVVASGGIINKVGTLPLAICAKAYNKPVYVLAESFKFQKECPLDQGDLPQEVTGEGYHLSRDGVNPRDGSERVSKPLVQRSTSRSAVHPRVDFTPAFYLDLLLTDIGIVTPMAVSHELIKLYT